MTKRKNYTLWSVQVLLALVFLFSGSMKLVLPLAVLTQQMPLPGWFVRFLGAAEVCGALGLVLPGLFRTRQFLTPLAAAGLVITMVGATVITAARIGAGPALMPLLIGVLASTIAYNRLDAPIQIRRKLWLAPLHS